MSTDTKQIVEQLRSEYGNTGNYQFPTEIVELPSRGHFYPKDNPLSSGKVEMKYMTAKEEDILTTQSYIQQGVVLDKLLQSMIVSNGNGEKINYNDMLLCDVNAVLISARVLGYGKDYTFKVTTPSGKEQEHTIDLTQLMPDDFDFSKYPKEINLFEIELPASKRKLEIKLLSQRDQIEIDKEVKMNKKAMGGLDTSLSTRLKYSIVSVDGKSDVITKNSFMNNLLALDSKALRKKINEITPTVNLEVDIPDEDTGETFRTAFPIGLDFFWPSA